MNVLMISPGYPAEMPLFTRGLARVGARVIGLGDQPLSSLPDEARESLSVYYQLPELWNEEAAVREVRFIHAEHPLDRVECLWEPGMLLAARLRQTLGLPGLTVAETVPFRNKEAMKQALDAAGIRTPRHRSARSGDGVRDAADAIGYPLIVKPIAGAGSADTYRADDRLQLEEIIRRIRHVSEVSVEEFIEGEEYTFDTICGDGRILFENVSWYRPRPLIARSEEWISPQTIALRDIDRPDLQPGREMGRAVLRALGFRSGFTHMEWFQKPGGEAVFGEIGARPPGARSVDLMNYCCDSDFFTGWAEAVVHGTLSQNTARKFNVSMICKRAVGQGQIRRVDGLDGFLGQYGAHVAAIDLLPVGAPRRDWLQTLISDGYVTVRHPNLARTLDIGDSFGRNVQMYAG